MICLTLWHLEQAKNAFREGLGANIAAVRCVSPRLIFSYDIQSQPLHL